MSANLISIWVDPSLFKNIAQALRCGEDSEVFYVAINANNTLAIYPTVRTICKTYDEKFKVIKLEAWKEGLVLWVGGKIVWKSWKDDANVVAELLKQNRSEVPNIPIGFTFNWSERNEINDFFTEIEKQGFKVVKDES